MFVRHHRQSATVSILKDFTALASDLFKNHYAKKAIKTALPSGPLFRPFYRIVKDGCGQSPVMIPPDELRNAK